MSYNKPQQMSPRQFETLCGKVYELCGINLKQGKEDLVHSRLAKRLNALQLDSYEKYFKLIDSDARGEEIIWMIDVLTTNKTSFFREIQHFDFLRTHVLPKLKKKYLRIWSAACSSGEEPYSIAITLAESLPDFRSWDVRILGTDISVSVLDKAKKAMYPDSALEPIPGGLRSKYFLRTGDSQKAWQVVPELTKLVKLAHLNLMCDFPMKGPFDVIFCRNAMIYFDKPTQELLVRKFYDLISPGGYLFVGHAESLTGANHDYRYVAPATYQK